eukprot:SAG11_NODE_11322_length_768_cov_4.623318_1_plen_66_part_00
MLAQVEEEEEEEEDSDDSDGSDGSDRTISFSDDEVLQYYGLRGDDFTVRPNALLHQLEQRVCDWL